MGEKRKSVRSELNINHEIIGEQPSSPSATVTDLLEHTDPLTSDDYVLMENQVNRLARRYPAGNLAAPAYGGLLVTDGSTAQTGIDGTPAVLTCFAANMAASLVTPDHTTDTLTITRAGVYAISVQMSFSGTLNEQVTVELYVDGVASGLKFDRKLGSGGDVGSASLAGLLSLDAGDVLDLRVNSDGTSISVTVTQGQLAVHSV